MLSELLVESFYAYIPESRGSSHALAVPSQKLTYAIKDGRKARGQDGGWESPYLLAAKRVARDMPVDSSLRSAASLIPIPGSLRPPPVPGPYRSVSREIARALAAEGIGGSVEDLLSRAVSLQKASKGGPRNAFVHRDSLRIVDGALPPKEPVVLVDDVTTSGAQMLGAALRLLVTFPGLTQVSGFALVRTVGEREFESIHAPARRIARLDPGADGTCSFLEFGTG